MTADERRARRGRLDRIRRLRRSVWADAYAAEQRHLARDRASDSDVADVHAAWRMLLSPPQSLD